MRVRYAEIQEPAYVIVSDRGKERTEALWPVMVDVDVNGKNAPLRFAWDRWHQVLYVDSRWPGRELLGDAAGAHHAAAVARKVLQKAADRASAK